MRDLEVAVATFTIKVCGKVYGLSLDAKPWIVSHSRLVYIIALVRLNTYN